MMNFVVGRATPTMIRDIRYGTYIFFAVFCLLMFLWVFFLVPETKNKTLEVSSLLNTYSLLKHFGTNQLAR